MRFFGLLLLLPLSSLSLSQHDDSRLSAAVRFDAKYLPLSDFAAEITKSTRVKVEVDRSIADRKVAIFAERPLGEIMTRVADALFLEWVTEGEGYRLRLQEEVAKEEKAMRTEEVRVLADGLRKSLQALAAIGRKPLETYRREYAAAKAEFDESTQDKSEKGKQRSAQLAYTLRQRFPYRGQREIWDRGYALSQLNPAQLEGLVRGEPYFASTQPRLGLGRLDLRSPDLIQEGGASPNPRAGGLLMAAMFDPGTRTLAFRYRTLGESNGILGTDRHLNPLEDPAYNQSLTKQPLVARIADWEKGREKAVLETLLSLPAETPATPAINAISQSDLLRWIHLKSGVPIVADAFRVAVNYPDFPQNGTIGDALRALTPKYYAPMIPPVPHYRADQGWLMLRHRRSWRRLDAELPERVLRPLEAKAKASGLTIDDYTNLVASMTPVQAANATRPEDFLVDIPTYAFRSIDALKLWARLPSGVRTSAQRNGVPLRSFSGPSLTALREYLVSRLLTGYPPEEWLTYMLPGGPNFPEDLVLRIQSDPTGRSVQHFADQRILRFNEYPNMDRIPFVGWRVSIVGSNDLQLLQDVTLHPRQ
jgi:hypothetical protein